MNSRGKGLGGAPGQRLGPWSCVVAVALSFACGEDGGPRLGLAAAVAGGAQGQTDRTGGDGGPTGGAEQPSTDEVARSAGTPRALGGAIGTGAPPKASAQEATATENDCSVAGPLVDPLPPEAQRSVRLVQDGFHFLEGPVWFQDQGLLLFSNMDFDSDQGEGPLSTIHQLDATGRVSVFLAAANSNGLAIAPDGRLLAATHDLRTLSLYDLGTKAREPLDLTYMSARLNSPNDVTVRSDGTVYFTDPRWQLGGRASETGFTGIYRITPGGVLFLLDRDRVNPNGITLSPDEAVLYVSAQDGLFSYVLRSDGTAQDAVRFADVDADGMVVDCAGNLYVTSDHVQVYAPNGVLLGSIAVPAKPSNVAFGGLKRSTLFITAGPGLYAIELNLPGFPY